MEATLLDYELTTNKTYMVYGKITLKLNLKEKGVRVRTEFMKIRMGVSQVGSIECGDVFLVSKKHLEFQYQQSDHLFA
jgi:hypothetical protein